ncbi:reverse transcriptase domain-containing protein [Tanacetum coccineum]
MPSHIKTYDGSEDLEDHLKIFQAAAKTEHWAILTWCHMFNSTLTGNARVWFDDLSKESIDSYDDLKKAFLENYLQQKKCIKDPVEIHNIKQRDGESTEEFVRSYKLERRDVKGAPECMKISGFMHGITNPELIKCLHDKILKSVEEMMRQQAGQRQNFKKGSFRNQQRSERKQDRFTLLIKTSKEILALDKGKFKPPSPMTTPVEKRNASKFYQFHGKVGHTTDECMHLKRQIELMLKAGKPSHLIKELKQNNGKDQAKAAKKRGNLRKRQATGNLDGTAMAEGSQTKDYPNLLSGDGDLISPLRGGGWDERSYDLRGQDGGTLCPPHLCGRKLLLRNPIAISIQRDHRKAGSKENPGSSVHGSLNAKISSDRQNEQVKTMKIQAGIQVSRPRELTRQLQLWKRFGRLYLIVFVLVRNIGLKPVNPIADHVTPIMKPRIRGKANVVEDVTLPHRV